MDNIIDLNAMSIEEDWFENITEKVDNKEMNLIMMVLPNNGDPGQFFLRTKNSQILAYMLFWLNQMGESALHSQAFNYIEDDDDE